MCNKKSVLACINLIHKWWSINGEVWQGIVTKKCIMIWDIIRYTSASPFSRSRKSKDVDAFRAKARVVKVKRDLIHITNVIKMADRLPVIQLDDRTSRIVITTRRVNSIQMRGKSSLRPVKYFYFSGNSLQSTTYSLVSRSKNKFRIGFHISMR